MSMRTARLLPITSFFSTLPFMAMHATPSAALLRITPLHPPHQRFFTSTSSAPKASDDDTIGAASAPKKDMGVREGKDGNPTSIWFFPNEWNTSTFLALMKPLKITQEETIHRSFGPAEYAVKYHTPEMRQNSYFVIDVCLEPEAFEGVSIYASHPELLRKIVKILDDSGRFRRFD